MTHKKAMLIVAAFAFIAYANTLMNGFIGDDVYLFGENTFYKNLSNLPRLVKKDFIMTADDVEPATADERSFSGCVSYRPVVALTFFCDYTIWKSNPFGHHLSNVLFHILASVLVYPLAWVFFKNHATAFFAAVLFAVHPIHTEAVNNIGYRSDLLATIFYLLAFNLFVRYKAAPDRKKIILAGAYASFFGAVFAKESAVTFPFMIAVYGFFFLRGPQKKDVGPPQEIKNTPWRDILEYAGFFAILFFYVYVYLFVFPNANSSQLFNPHFDLLSRFTIAAKIFYSYLAVLFLPFKITILPLLYAPALSAVRNYEIIWTVIFILACGALAATFLKRNRPAAFLIAWFLMTYVPMANIMLLPNPFAYRFMYLPSIGIFVFLAFAIENISVPFLRRITKIFIIGLCLAVTMPLNMFYKNNFVVAKKIIQDYPDSSRPYRSLGAEYLKRGRYDEAIENLHTYLAHGEDNPFTTMVRHEYAVRYMLGLCYVHDNEKARVEFKEAIRLRPDYILPYVGIAKTFVLENNCQEALPFALQAIAINENFIPGYVYAIHCHMALGNKGEAKELLEAALGVSAQDEDLKYLEKLLRLRQ